MATRLRVPAWSKIASLAINSQPQHVVAEDGWLTLERAWKPGDNIAFTIPLPVWLSRPNSDEVLALPAAKDDVLLKDVRLFRGPLLLAIDKARIPRSLGRMRGNSRCSFPPRTPSGCPRFRTREGSIGHSSIQRLI